MTISTYRPRAHFSVRAVLWNGENIEEVRELIGESPLVRGVEVTEQILQLSDSSSSEWYIQPGQYLAIANRISVHSPAEFLKKFELTDG